MPHIESTSKSHAPKASYAPSSHQPKVADSARGTFESMLDDNAADAKAAVKDANQSATADRTQQTPAPKAKSDTNAVDGNKPADQTAPQTAAPDQTQAQTTDKPIDPAVVAAQTDAVAATVGTDKPAESKSDSDKPATDATTAPDAASALPVVPTVPTVPTVPAAVVTVPTLTPADAQPAPTQATEQIAATAPVVATVAGQQQVQKGDLAGATVATDDTSKAAAKDGKDQPAQTAQTEQATDGDQVAAQPQQQAPVDGDKAKAPQAALSKTDMEHIARARGESSDKTDPTSSRSQNDQADTTVTAKTDVPTQTVQTVQSAHQTQTTAATPAATHTQTTSQVPVAVPLAAVAVSIANKAVAGAREFEIRLDPPELGRIEVKMHVDRDGNVTSRLIADRQDTLDLLKRDSSGLERALQDAGLKTSDNGLQFSLRDQSLPQQQQNDGNGKSNTLFVQDEKLPVVDVPVQNYGRLAGRTSGLDIRV